MGSSRILQPAACFRPPEHGTVASIAASSHRHTLEKAVLFTVEMSWVGVQKPSCSFFPRPLPPRGKRPSRRRSLPEQSPDTPFRDSTPPGEGYWHRHFLWVPTPTGVAGEDEAMNPWSSSNNGPRAGSRVPVAEIVHDGPNLHDF